VRALTDVLVEANYDMCSVHLLALLLLLVTVTQREPKMTLEVYLERLKITRIKVSLVIIFRFIDSIKRLLLQLDVVELRSAANNDDGERHYDD